MYEKIPSELKEKTQWVNVWNSSKVPMQTGQKKLPLLCCLILGELLIVLC